MESTLTLTHQTPPSGPARTDGTLVRKFAIAAGALYSMFVAVLLVAAPDLVYFVPLWFFWVLVMVPVIATYVGAHVLRRRASGRQSRRTRRWIATRQTR